ncbi:MAG: cytochrome c biogenesis CcdA family protein [Bacilli bacterium]
MINNILDIMGEIINNNYLLAPIIAFFAGVLTSFTPCSLSTVPLMIAYVSGNDNKKRTLKMSLMFCLGTTLTFITLGVLASTFNTAFYFVGDFFYVILSIICILMVLQLWEVINIVPNNNLVSKFKKKGYVGALVTGILAGLFSSPCSTPVLIVLLAIVGTKGSILYGIILLLYYSLGHSVLAIISGISMNYVKSIKKNKNYKKISDLLNYIFGIIILLMAFYFFYLGI